MKKTPDKKSAKRGPKKGSPSNNSKGRPENDEETIPVKMFKRVPKSIYPQCASIVMECVVRVSEMVKAHKNSKINEK